MVCSVDVVSVGGKTNRAKVSFKDELEEVSQAWAALAAGSGAGAGRAAGEAPTN